MFAHTYSLKYQTTEGVQTRQKKMSDLVDFDQAESVFVDRDEADFLDEEQANEVVLIESDSTIQLPASMTIIPGTP